DAPEVLALRKDLGLEREEGAARVDQVDARESVLERDLLRPHVLLHRERVVRPALHRRVVRDHRAFAARDAPDAGDDPGARPVVAVAAVRGERGELEEGRSGRGEGVDAVADEELPARAVTVARLVRAAARGARAGIAEVRDERLHVGCVGAEFGVGGTDAGGEPAHQNSDRRRASPSASIVAIRAFTCSTFSPITSSSSCGLPSKRIGSPKKIRYLTGSGMVPRSPSHGHVSVTGKAGMRRRRASGATFAIAIACSSEPTTAIGTTGVSVSRAR